MNLNKTSPAVLEISQRIYEENEDISSKDFKNKFIKTIVEELMISNYEDCD
jgi:hypothetical protein